MHQEITIMQEGVLALKTNDKLTHIVYQDQSKHSSIIYKVVECGFDDIEELLKQTNENTHNNN